MRTPSVLGWTIGLIGLAGLALFFGIWGSLRSYRVLAEEEWVAIVHCERYLKRDATVPTYWLELTPVVGGVPGRPQRFLMHGDEWAIGGDVVKWHPRLAFLGFKPYYKLTRLHSRYSAVQDEKTQPRSVYELNGGSGWIWRWLSRCGVRLPGVDAVYGQAVYMTARPGVTWGVYVTHSGFFVRPLPKRMRTQ
jgi:hypothetical protein